MFPPSYHQYRWNKWCVLEVRRKPILSIWRSVTRYYTSLPIADNSKDHNSNENNLWNLHEHWVNMSMWQVHVPSITTEHNRELIALELIEGLRHSRLQTYSLPQLPHPASDNRRMPQRICYSERAMKERLYFLFSVKRRGRVLRGMMPHVPNHVSYIRIWLQCKLQRAVEDYKVRASILKYCSSTFLKTSEHGENI